MKAILDHIGIAVGDLDSALAFYRDALGLDIEPSEEVTSQRVRAHFVPVGESHLRDESSTAKCSGVKLELLEATAPDSPIARYVEKRGPGLHHITLRVDDIVAALAQLKARGTRLIDEQPRPGAEGALVAFIHPSSAHGVLVELKQSTAVSRPAAAGGHPSVGMAPPSTAAGPQSVTRFTLGDLELISLCDGFFRVDGGAIFGIVPRPVWSAKMPPDERNRVRLAIRPLVVRGVRTMIIDAGLGDQLDETFQDLFGVERAHALDQSLAEAGLTPDDIDLVLATHLHVDHAGGFVKRDASGRLRPRFPRARYVARRGEWEDAQRVHVRNRASYNPEHLLPLAEAGVLELVDQDQTIMPGVRVRRTGGHTMHHQMVWIESGGKQAAYLADLVPTIAHLPDPWIAAVDLYPMDTLAAKSASLKEATECKTLVFFDHDPAMAAGYVVDENGKRRIVAELS